MQAKRAFNAVTLPELPQDIWLLDAVHIRFIHYMQRVNVTIGVFNYYNT